MVPSYASFTFRCSPSSPARRSRGSALRSKSGDAEVSGILRRPGVASRLFRLPPPMCFPLAHRRQTDAGNGGDGLGRATRLAAHGAARSAAGRRAGGDRRARHRLQLLRHPDGAGQVSGEAAAAVLARRRDGRRRARRRAGRARHSSRGDRVFAMLGWGGFASVAWRRRPRVVRMPDAMPFEHGAAFGIVYQTSYFGLVYRANLQAGETLLVHAAAGGVGLAAVQIGTALGARVLATAGSAEKLDVAHAARRRGGVRLLDARLGRAGEAGHRRPRRRRHLRSGRRRHLRPVDQVHRLRRPPAGHRLRLGTHPDDPGQPHSAEEHRRSSACTGAPTASTSRRRSRRRWRRCSSCTSAAR